MELLASVLYNAFVAVSSILVALVSYCVLDVYVIRRKRGDVIKESYPFENTVVALQNQDKFLEEVNRMFTERGQERNGKQTFSLNVVGLPNYIFVNDGPNVEYILKGNFDNFTKGPLVKGRFFDLLGDGIFNADGKLWLNHRKTSVCLFSANRFKTKILDTFNAHLSIVVDLLRQAASTKSQAIEMQSLLHRFTLDSIGIIAFDSSIRSLEQGAPAFAEAFDWHVTEISNTFTDPLWMPKRLLRLHAYYSRLAVINSFAFKMVTEKRQAVAAGTAGSDLLSLYLEKEMEAESKEKFTDKDLRDVILNFVIAGRDTTAQALSWSFYRLCLHPHIQHLVREEVLGVLANEEGQTEDGHISFEALSKLKYTEAFLLETLRFHPSVPKEAKFVVSDCVLPDGTKVFRGDTVVFCPWTMGRNKAIWGEDALEFNPDRFVSNLKPSPFLFTAFQAGPRTCLGQSLAMLEMKVEYHKCSCFEENTNTLPTRTHTHTHTKTSLAQILRQFSFTLACDPSSITYVNSLTLPIKGSFVVITLLQKKNNANQKSHIVDFD